MRRLSFARGFCPAAASRLQARLGRGLGRIPPNAVHPNAPEAQLPAGARALSSDAAAAAAQHAKPTDGMGALVSPAWLQARLDDVEDVRVVECANEPAAYRRGHIPNAVNLPVHPYLKSAHDPRSLITAPELASLLEHLHVDAGTTVVLYDEHNSLLAARMWWVLMVYGHDPSRVKILNGGWNRWLNECRFVTIKTTCHLPRTQPYRPAPASPARLATAADVAAGGLQLADTRSMDEFTGRNPAGNPRAGHVPGAVPCEWTRAVARNDFREVLPPDQQRLAALFDADGPPVVTYCQAGIRAAHTAFVLEHVLGFGPVRVYDRSMAEWTCQPELPLELGRH